MDVLRFLAYWALTGMFFGVLLFGKVDKFKDMVEQHSHFEGDEIKFLIAYSIATAIVGPFMAIAYFKVIFKGDGK